MWWQWVVFAFVIVIVPFAIGYFCVYIKKRNKLTKEQEKIMNLNMAKYWLFYWLCDLFYMSFIIDNIVCKYIFGCLILIMTLYSLTMSFVSNTIKNGVHRICVLQDFIISIALTVYLIYITPGTLVETNGIVTIDNSLRDIITTIVAAVYGGLLTLVGVAWTIRKGDKDRHEDEVEKFKPAFWIFTNDEKPNILFDFRSNLNRFSEAIQNNYNNYNWVSIGNFSIQNSDKTAFFIYGFLIDEKIYEVNNKFVVNKDNIVRFFVQDYHIEQFNIFYIIVEDLIGNLYKCRFLFNNESNHEIKIYGCTELLIFKRGKITNE